MLKFDIRKISYVEIQHMIFVLVRPCSASTLNHHAQLAMFWWGLVRSFDALSLFFEKCCVFFCRTQSYLLISFVGVLNNNLWRDLTNQSDLLRKNKNCSAMLEFTTSCANFDRALRYFLAIMVRIFNISWYFLLEFSTPSEAFGLNLQVFLISRGRTLEYLMIFLWLQVPRSSEISCLNS